MKVMKCMIVVLSIILSAGIGLMIAIETDESNNVVAVQREDANVEVNGDVSTQGVAPSKEDILDIKKKLHNELDSIAMMATNAGESSKSGNAIDFKNLLSQYETLSQQGFERMITLNDTIENNTLKEACNDVKLAYMCFGDSASAGIKYLDKNDNKYYEKYISKLDSVVKYSDGAKTKMNNIN